MRPTGFLPGHRRELFIQVSDVAVFEASAGLLTKNPANTHLIAELTIARPCQSGPVLAGAVRMVGDDVGLVDAGTTQRVELRRCRVDRELRGRPPRWSAGS